MSFFSLTYVSSASGLYDKAVYRGIARDSAIHNADHDITGMLLVYNETIIQFLEGAEDIVEALYARIELDPRHKNPIVVSRRQCTTREFSNWSMGFQELIADSESDFLFQLNKQSLSVKLRAADSDTTAALLKSFKRSSGMV